uniref:Uncharacterized protein n=1 Tax=Anguilla anguilla TaxID=7936 RepID=A0A0E9VZE0_ANGAN
MEDSGGEWGTRRQGPLKEDMWDKVVLSRKYPGYLDNWSSSVMVD